MLQAVTEQQNRMAYSIKEAAQQTTLSKEYLRLEIKRGKLKARRIGRRILILHEDLQAYLKRGVAI